LISRQFDTLNNNIERAILIAVARQGTAPAEVLEHLDELEFLAETAGAETVGRLTQNLQYPEPRTYLGKGKLEELHGLIAEKEAHVVIVDDELSAAQQRNMERALNEGKKEDESTKIIDRSTLILGIFADRARTAQSRVQVELAQMQYLLPRLTGLWSHLSKQRGGVGMKGPGEKEIETDRRIINDRVALLKEKLKEFDKQAITQRKNRTGVIRVSLVGYTNVGKSTLMNLLSKSELLAENKLFATLDSTARKVVIDRTPFVLSDTVGFIRKLPHHLVESFKSTLDEVREADLLLHVVDISHPAFEDHMAVVQTTLGDIGAGDKPIIHVFNKIDRLASYPVIDPENEEENPPITRAELENSYLSKSLDAVFISAVEGIGIEELRVKLIERVRVLASKAGIYVD
jgi:GTP-binding protein HflX